MAHFAKINDNNIVETILVISNEHLGDSDFPESEPLGQVFLEETGNSGHWLHAQEPELFFEITSEFLR